ncbi:MAG TPA: DotU family type IV/VI secretion system protein [Phycisphaerae bacterium]|nr:DotU family type IV/VI secretion system protein [Phycisphaerae bacterium]
MTLVDLNDPFFHFLHASEARVTLPDLTEPFFQYFCRLNRSARNGAQLDADQVQADINELLAKMKGKAAASHELADEFEKIELPLIFFADFTMKEGGYTISKKWKEIASNNNELNGNEKFFTLLDETLKDNSPAAIWRLKIFSACMGLGFSGSHKDQPEYLKKKVKEIRARLYAGAKDADIRKICPENYEHINTANLIEPPGVKLFGIAVVLLACIVTLLIANFYLFHQSVGQLNNALDKILQK